MLNVNSDLPHLVVPIFVKVEVLLKKGYAGFENDW
jgi:hypothetical protein